MRLLLLLEDDQIGVGLCSLTEPVEDSDHISDSVGCSGDAHGDTTEDEYGTHVDTQGTTVGHVDTQEATAVGPLIPVAGSLVVTAAGGDGKPFYCCRIGSCKFTTCRRPNAERYLMYY